MYPADRIHYWSTCAAAHGFFSFLLEDCSVRVNYKTEKNRNKTFQSVFEHFCLPYRQSTSYPFFL